MSSQGAVVVSGSTATLSCTTNTTRSLRWIMYAPQSTDDTHIYDGGKLHENFTNRHNVSRVADNHGLQYTLVINNVQPHDAGKYKCVEVGDVKNNRTFELIVLGACSMFLLSASLNCFTSTFLENLRNSDAQHRPIAW
jgi:Immunoglobulin domain